MAQTEFAAALNQVASERGIDPTIVVETIKTALVSAYRKDYGGDLEGLTADIDSETGEAHIYENGKDVTPAGFGRIAAQTAKQVILQRIRESEKEAIIEEYRKKIGTIMSGHIFRVEKGLVIIELGRAQGIMPPSEQIPGEQYTMGQRIKILVADVSEGPRGPEIIISRSRSEFVAGLFALEVPEMANGVVKAMSVAREAGERTKIAVASSQENVDPVGSCVGQKGVRVQSVIAELGDEKIDIIHYSEDPAKYIANSLSPAKVIDVKLDKSGHEANVEVFADQLSLAIGRGGQNVRLAAKLTGWKIDIAGAGGEKTEKGKTAEVESSELEKAGLSKRIVNALETAEIRNLEDLKNKTNTELKEIKGLGPKAIEEIKTILQ